MARALFNALQAVMAGVGGGAQGYAQYQEMERRRQQEQAERERQQAMDMINILGAGGRIEGQGRPASAPPGGAQPGAKMEAKGAPPPEFEETPVEIPGIGRVMVGGPTPAERRRIAADAEEQRLEAEKATQSTAALRSALSQFPETELPPRYREAILSGNMDITQALSAVRAGRERPTGGGSERTKADLMKEVNDSVEMFVRSLSTMTRDEDTDTGMVRRPLYTQAQVRDMAKEYRQTVMEQFGLTPPPQPAPEPRRPTGSNTPAILNQFSPYGAEGPASPMEWSSSSGRRFRF